MSSEAPVPATGWFRGSPLLRQLLHSPTGPWALGVVMIAGFAGWCESLAEKTWGGTYLPAPFTWSLAVVCGSYTAVIAISIHAGVLSVVARRLGGVGSGRETWRALAWGSLPSALALPVWLVEAFLLGSRGHAIVGYLEEGPAAALADQLFASHQLVLGIAQFGLSLVLVAEAHRFSAWRALAAAVLTTAAVGGVVLGGIALLAWPP